MSLQWCWKKAMPLSIEPLLPILTLCAFYFCITGTGMHAWHAHGAQTSLCTDTCVTIMLITTMCDFNLNMCDLSGYDSTECHMTRLCQCMKQEAALYTSSQPPPIPPFLKVLS